MTLIQIDEADRLKRAGLEQVRNLFDRGNLALVLIGMPGLEKRLSRYAQLYSRVGFVHAFRPLGEAEMRHLLKEKWRQMGLSLTEGDFTDEEATAAILRLTSGNFRVTHIASARDGAGATSEGDARVDRRDGAPGPLQVTLALLDANVLYPPALRDLFLWLAAGAVSR